MTPTALAGSWRKTSLPSWRRTGAAALLCFSVFFYIPSARAQADAGERAGSPPAVSLPDATPPAASPNAAPPPTAILPPTAQPVTSGADLSFDLYSDAPKESAAETQRQHQAAQDTERKGRIRRAMLTTHQALGFSTLAMLAATLIIGQLNYQDKYVSGDFSGRYEQAHLGLGIATTGLFATTGVLALFAPSPYAKKYRLDSAMVHRVAMALATAGMVTQIVLGPIIDTHAGQLDQPRLALGHLVTGYATFAFMATGTLAYVF